MPGVELAPYRDELLSLCHRKGRELVDNLGHQFGLQKRDLVALGIDGDLLQRVAADDPGELVPGSQITSR